MTSSFAGLGAGVGVAIVLVYLLIVVNFQSWLDPFIIITALPGALAGIIWILLLTHTTLSVPSLTGTIMCMGVATANSILMVSFARERLNEGLNSTQAALQAGYVRIRPVLMTALAMIIGMVPLSLGLGEGGEQNAPLGRAVIGGLIVATFATLFFVPCVFSLVHKRHRAGQARRRRTGNRIVESSRISGSKSGMSRNLSRVAGTLQQSDGRARRHRQRAGRAAALVSDSLCDFSGSGHLCRLATAQRTQGAGAADRTDGGAVRLRDSRDAHRRRFGNGAARERSRPMSNLRSMRGPTAT